MKKQICFFFFFSFALVGAHTRNLISGSYSAEIASADKRRDEKRRKKTTSEIRKQIKYFINYLYFHNMII